MVGTFPSATRTVVVAAAPGGMVPPTDAFPDVLPSERLNVRAMPSRPLRDELVGSPGTELEFAL